MSNARKLSKLVGATPVNLVDAGFVLSSGTVAGRFSTGEGAIEEITLDTSAVSADGQLKVSSDGKTYFQSNS